MHQFSLRCIRKISHASAYMVRSVCTLILPTDFDYPEPWRTPRLGFIQRLPSRWGSFVIVMQSILWGQEKT